MFDFDSQNVADIHFKIQSTFVAQTWDHYRWTMKSSHQCDIYWAFRRGSKRTFLLFGVPPAGGGLGSCLILLCIENFPDPGPGCIIGTGALLGVWVNNQADLHSLACARYEELEVTVYEGGSTGAQEQMSKCVCLHHQLQQISQIRWIDEKWTRLDSLGS